MKFVLKKQATGEHARLGKMICVDHHCDLKCLPNPKWYSLWSQIYQLLLTQLLLIFETGWSNLEGFPLFVTD